MKKAISASLGTLVVIILAAFSFFFYPSEKETTYSLQVPLEGTVVEGRLSDAGGLEFYYVDGNTPSFDVSELQNGPVFESYSELDELGRAGVAYARLGTELMPTQKRGDISGVHPTGWEQNPYDFVDGQYLYNRTHLIAHMLAGENANEKNLITGTRTLNLDMIPFEDLVYDYITDTGGQVLYRVTPVYAGDNLLASGVIMEAYSLEDAGARVSYNVFIPNVEEGVEIDYATGQNREAQ